jgi:condensin complex subunit 1
LCPFSLDTKFTRQRSKLTPLAVRHLSDKSASVRRYAIALVTKLVVTHPFGIMYGGDLCRETWEKRLDDVRHNLDALETRLQEEEIMPDGMGGAFGGSNEEGEDEGEDEDDEGEVGEEKMNEDGEGEAQVKKEKMNMSKADDGRPRLPPVDNNLVIRERMSHDYHSEALKFILQVEEAIPKLNELLTSTGRAEVLEAMDFFKVAHEYEFSAAKVRSILPFPPSLISLLACPSA